MSQFIDIAVKSLVAYFLLLVLTRIMGKREISQLTYFDYVVGITIGSIAGIMATDKTSNWYVMSAGLLVFALLQILSAYISLKSIKFRNLVNGVSTTLIKKGNIIEKNLKKERISTSVLESMLREKNIFSFADVEYAILENSGKISTQLKSEKMPLTPHAMKLQTRNNGLPLVVIEDGVVVSDNLKQLGLTRAWILSKLGDNGIHKVSDVMLAQLDEAGNLYIDKYDNQV